MRICIVYGCVHARTDTHGRNSKSDRDTGSLARTRLSLVSSCPNYLLDEPLYHLGRDGASTVHVFTYACTEIQ